MAKTAIGFVILLSSGGFVQGITPEQLHSYLSHNRARMENIRYHVRYKHYWSPGARERALMEAKSAGADLQTIQAIEMYARGPNGEDYVVQEQRVVFDNKGRMKTEFSGHLIDFEPSGAKVVQHELVDAWDGVMAISFRESQSHRPAGATIDRKPPWALTTGQRPDKSFGTDFAETLVKAMQQKGPLEIIEHKDSIRISFDMDGMQHRATVRTDMGYAVTEYCKLRNAVKVVSFEAKFAVHDDDIWFPATGTITGYSADGGPQRISEVTVTDVIINDPNFSGHMFHVNLPEGTIVKDQIARIGYKVGDPLAVWSLDRPYTTSEIILDSVGDTNDASSNISRAKTIYLPTGHVAVTQDQAFILNFESGRLLRSAKNITLEEMRNRSFVRDVKAGDIFWDGEFIMVGDAKMTSVYPAEQKPLIENRGVHGVSYGLPESTELPYYAVVEVDHVHRYMMAVQIVEEDGLKVMYERVSNENARTRNP